MRAALLGTSVLIAACAGAPLSVESPSPSATARPPSATAGPSVSAAPSATANPAPSASPSLAPTPTPTAAGGRAPYCAVADVLTPERDYARHAATFLDWTYALPDSYEPPDLVNALTGADRGPAQRRLPDEPPSAVDRLAVRGDPAYATLLADDRRAAVRGATYPDLSALRQAAELAGRRVVILSAYRSYAEQVATFDYWVRVGGYEQALRTSARPGHSEHQLGTTVDFGDGLAAPWEYDDWAATATGAWLAEHAAEFGFVMSYPAGKSAVTCYAYEPWHYRWVGRDVASRVVASRLALRELQGGPR